MSFFLVQNGNTDLREVLQVSLVWNIPSRIFKFKNCDGSKMWSLIVNCGQREKCSWSTQVFRCLKLTFLCYT
jgi:hypothetical protein